MKAKILFTVFLMLIVSACAKKKFKVPVADIPKEVITNFEQKYPNAQVAEWEAEKEGDNLVYEVGFTMDGAKKEAAFNADGSFKKEE